MFQLKINYSDKITQLFELGFGADEVGSVAKPLAVTVVHGAVGPHINNPCEESKTIM